MVAPAVGVLSQPATAAGSPGHVRHLAGLDGLRAIAVLAVIAYHADPGWAPGGYLGVEVFFVISGYLITALLLAERERTGHIDLRAFWFRRARRLLPALFLLLAATLAFAVFFLPDQVARLRGDVLAAGAYVTNWYLILRQQSYFVTIGRPSPLGHLWSLAVEEQFYVGWPVLLAVGLAVLSRKRMLWVALGIAAVSAALMAVLYRPDADPSAIYYGTETRLTGLLLGAALAFVWVPVDGRVPGSTHRILRRMPWDVIALAGLAFMGACFALLDEYQPLLYRGGFVALDLATVAVIAAAVHPGARIGRLALDRQPLRWLGERSYGIYLWHWPVFTVTRPQLDVALQPLPDLLLRLGVVLLLAEVSYRFVETPVRRGALGRAWRAWRAAQGRRTPLYRLRLAGGGALAVAVMVLGAQVAVATPPATPHYLALAPVRDDVGIARENAGASSSTSAPTASAHAAATASADATTTASADGAPTGTSLPSGAGVPVAGMGAGVPTGAHGPPGAPTGSPDASGSASPGPAGPGGGATAAPTTAGPVEDVGPGLGAGLRPPAQVAPATPAPSRVFALGDSVLLGAVPELRRAIPGIEIDAVVGRSFAAGIGILQQMDASGSLPGTVVVALGDNGWLTTDQVDEAMHALAGVEHVAFVNLKEPRSWEAHDNQVLAAAASRYPNLIVIDWHAASEDHPAYFWDDGIHLRPAGAQAYASLIASSLDR